MRMLIVGGGIAGLSLNLALRDTPWHVELVERSVQWNRLGAGLAIQPNATRALRQLGAASSVTAAGSTIDRFQYRDQHGTLLCDIDLHRVWGDVGPFVGITRQALHDALRPGAEHCRIGSTVTSVKRGNGQMSVSFDTETPERYDLVVGADGINSAIRRCLFERTGPTYAGQMAWRSVAPIRPTGLDGVQFWLGQDRFFGLCPAGNGMTYGFGNIAGTRSHEPIAGRKRRLLEHFGGFGTPVQQYLAAVPHDSDIHCAPIEWLPEVAWHNDDAVLIGDAAHAMSPMMGQGGCMAIEDALVLADELRHAAHPADIPGTLAAFAARRHPRVQWVRQQSHALGELVRLPAHIRDGALREHGTTAFHDRYQPLVAAP
jgi:2-polyprenyl-6-methoxyphenol hydroxylase-like FAD-dependent oxidoreductase